MCHNKGLQGVPKEGESVVPILETGGKENLEQRSKIMRRRIHIILGYKYISVWDSQKGVFFFAKSD
jgi:hypothetical protein